MKNRKLKILIGCFVVVVAIFAVMVAKGFIVFDHSAERGFENSIIWKDVRYEPVPGRYKEGKTIAKVKDSGLSINEVEGDDSHTFVVVRSFIDQWLVVREDYNIPKSGKITKAYWAHQLIEDEEFFSVVAKLMQHSKPDFMYDNSADDIYQYKGDDVMRQLVVAYEDCPVPTNYLGYIGTMGGKWCMTVGDYRKDKIDCYYIPDEYIPVFEKYWSV